MKRKNKMKTTFRKSMLCSFTALLLLFGLLADKFPPAQDTSEAPGISLYNEAPSPIKDKTDIH